MQRFSALYEILQRHTAHFLVGEKGLKIIIPWQVRTRRWQRCTDVLQMSDEAGHIMSVTQWSWRVHQSENMGALLKLGVGLLRRTCPSQQRLTWQNM